MKKLFSILLLLSALMWPLQVHSNPTLEVANVLIIDGSADTDIVTTNFGKSSAISVEAPGRLTKVCLIVTGTAPFSEDGSLFFFDADPTITSNTADLTEAEALTVVLVISLNSGGYIDLFAASKINCQKVDEKFHFISYVAYLQEGSTTIENQDFNLHMWYVRE